MLRQYKMNCIVIGATMIFVLLAISFVGIVPSETLAQTKYNNCCWGARHRATGAGGGGETGSYATWLFIRYWWKRI